MKWKFGFLITSAVLVAGGLLVTSCGDDNNNVTNPSARVSPEPTPVTPTPAPVAPTPAPVPVPPTAPTVPGAPTPQPGKFVIFTGTISDIGRATITVSGVEVIVDDAGRTKIRHAGKDENLKLGDLSVGDTVRIKGVWDSSGTSVGALDIAIQP